MRHSRRAVMAEQYKLYMKRNVFNGRYFVRNMQIVFCAVIVIALLIGIILLSGSKSDVKNTADAKKIDVKEALLGNNDVTEAELAAKEDEEVADAKEESTTEASTEAVAVMSEITAAADDNTDEAASDLSVDDLKETEVAVSGQAATTDKDEEISETKSEEADRSEEGEFANRCIANVDETLNVRKEPSPDAEFVGSMSKGAIATVEGTEGDWTKIKSGDVEGYVLSEFVLTGRVAEEYSKNYVTLQGTALEDGINIREEKSTDSDILKVLDKDDVVSVIEVPGEESKSEETDLDKAADETEESATDDTVKDTSADVEKEIASEGINWLTVMLEDGQIGYVSEDYIDVDKLYTLAVSAEELQRREQERIEAERAAAEAEMLAQQEAAASNANSSGDSSSSYQGATTTPVTAASSGESLGTFRITAYCGCSKCSGGHNKTASGTTPTQGRTIAADTSILPYGTQVVIDGIVYTVEDCGSGVNGNHIDIFFATHEAALAYGSKTVTVYKY